MFNSTDPLEFNDGLKEFSGVVCLSDSFDELILGLDCVVGDDGVVKSVTKDVETSVSSFYEDDDSLRSILAPFIRTVEDISYMAPGTARTDLDYMDYNGEVFIPKKGLNDAIDKGRLKITVCSDEDSDYRIEVLKDIEKKFVDTVSHNELSEDVFIDVEKDIIVETKETTSFIRKGFGKVFGWLSWR